MSKPIIALDFSSLKETKDFLKQFKDESLYVKIGMELFYQTGPEIITWINSQGHDIFLDLKLHDIPNTVYRSMRGIARLGVSMTNVHAAGGSEMMEAALKGLREGTPAGLTVPKLIAVTQLTSTTEETMRQEQLIEASLIESVCHYATLAEKAGLDGVVCSAMEAATIKENSQGEFICVTPGIRPNTSQFDDQKRVVTPQRARELGSDFIVVGRPITQTTNPVTAYLTIKDQWNGVTH